MSEKNEYSETILHNEHKVEHPFVRGVLAGAAVGAGLGLLFAPRTGSQVRHAIGHRWSDMRASCATGYTRTKHTVGDWAHGTRGYVREVSDAVTRKVHRNASIGERRDRGFSAVHESAQSIGSRG